MAFVITEPCLDVKDGACVDICPVDCIHTAEGERQYFIHPAECIDCGACEPVCPVNAIYAEDAVPPKWREYVAKNAAFFEKK